MNALTLPPSWVPHSHRATALTHMHTDRYSTHTHPPVHTQNRASTCVHTPTHTIKLILAHKSTPPLPHKHLHTTNSSQRQHLQLWGLLLFPPVVSSSGAGSQVVVLLLLFQPQAPLLQLATSDAIKSSAEFDQICRRKLGPEWVNAENKQAD